MTQADIARSLYGRYKPSPGCWLTIPWVELHISKYLTSLHTHCNQRKQRLTKWAPSKEAGRIRINRYYRPDVDIHISS